MPDNDSCGCPLPPEACPVPLDPRVRHAKKRPRTAPQCVRLAQDVAHLGALVHARLDKLGAPRTLDGGELTLLGRLDLWLDDVEVEFTSARVLRNLHAAMDGTRALRSKADYMALPGVVAVAERGPCDVYLFVEPAMTTTEIDALSRIVQERRQVNVIVEIERDRRSAERRERAPKVPATEPPVIGEQWKRRTYLTTQIGMPIGAPVYVVAADREKVVFTGTRATYRLPTGDFMLEFERARP